MPKLCEEIAGSFESQNAIGQNNEADEKNGRPVALEGAEAGDR
jgi:hypothetical protein